VPHCDQFLHEGLRQRTVDREVEGALGHRVALKLIGDLREDGAAEWQVAQVILERGKAGDGLTAHAEGGHAVRDHPLGVWDDLKNGPAQCLKRAALRLIDAPAGTRQPPLRTPPRSLGNDGLLIANTGLPGLRSLPARSSHPCWATHALRAVDRSSGKYDPPYRRLEMTAVAITIESATTAPSAPSQLNPTVLRT